jgi:hypothetical protein
VAQNDSSRRRSGGTHDQDGSHFIKNVRTQSGGMAAFDGLGGTEFYLYYVDSAGPVKIKIHDYHHYS